MALNDAKDWGGHISIFTAPMMQSNFPGLVLLAAIALRWGGEGSIRGLMDTSKIIHSGQLIQTVVMQLINYLHKIT
jgi:hypothetical protein